MNVTKIKIDEDDSNAYELDEYDSYESDEYDSYESDIDEYSK